LIEWRFADGKLERLSDLAAELVRLKVDVIVAPGSPAIRAAQNATTTIPIVSGHHKRSGRRWFRQEPGEPRGNITGCRIWVATWSQAAELLLRCAKVSWACW
jgi:putative ABC transport system substrate-binding protein